MNTKTLIIRNVPIDVAEHLLDRAKAMGFRGLTPYILELMIYAVREYAHVLDKGDCFFLVNAENGEPIPGVAPFIMGDDKTEARRQAEVEADEKGYLVWQHTYGEEPPPYMEEGE